MFSRTSFSFNKIYNCDELRNNQFQDALWDHVIPSFVSLSWINLNVVTVETSIIRNPSSIYPEERSDGKELRHSNQSLKIRLICGKLLLFCTGSDFPIVIYLFNRLLHNFYPMTTNDIRPGYLVTVLASCSRLSLSLPSSKRIRCP